MKKLRVGVVGVGHIGSNHARIYSEIAAAADFTAIYDIDLARAHAIAEKYGGTVAKSLEEFAERVDAASVATTTSSHHEVGLQLLQRGKHLLIEKPITENPQDAAELAELAGRNRLILQVGHVERFNPVLSALEARLTHPRFIEAHRLSPYPNRSTDIGVVLDLMIHDLEIILHLVRSPVQSIDAVGVPVLSKGEDIANARIRFENGCIANITSSRISPERMRKIRVFQEDAYLSLDYENQTGEIHRRENGQITRDKVPIEREEPLKQQLISFVECASTGREPKVSGFQATAALELAVEITKRIGGIAKTIYFVAGEASADNHGAALMRELRKAEGDLCFVGRGGPQMKSIAGKEFRNWIARSGVLGLWEVIKHYGYFRKQFQQTLREIHEHKPNAVVLIDYPGFNLRLARALRVQLPSQKIIYYISPQVWAWNPARIKKMVHSLDLMLCLFPFEADLYNESGLRTLFVGHPLIEQLSEKKIDLERDPNLVGLFPGSRAREVRKIFPVLIKTVHELRRSKPHLRFEVASASSELAHEIERILKPRDRHLFSIKIGETYEIMRRAFVGIVASGSATLEAAYFRMPCAIVYKVAWSTYGAGRLLVKVQHLGMPNVLVGREIVPEFIQHRAKPHDIAKAITRLIDDPEARQEMIAEFDKIAAELGGLGASERAAKAILAEIA